MELIALKTFSAGGSKLILQGETFTAKEQRAKEYMRLNLAEPANGTKTAAAPKPIEKDIARTDYTTEELQEKNLTELKKIAKNIGVTGYSGMSKSEVIFAIRSQQSVNNTNLEG